MVDEKKKSTTSTSGKILPAKVNVVKKTTLSATTKHGIIIKKIRHETEEEKVNKSLRASTNEGMFNASASSITNTFITPLALELKATNAEIGLLTAVQNFANTIGQIPGAKLTEYYPRKSIWMLSQIMSKILLWIPIIFLPFLQLDNPVIILIILMGFIAFFAGLRSPAWSSLMGDLVPLKTRGRYFGMRNMLTGIAGIVATIIAGIVVAEYGFSVIFIAAVLLGIVSIFFFIRMYEPQFKRVFYYKHTFNFRPNELVKSLSVNKALVIFTVYLFFMNFAVEIAAPFYTVYMLKDLQINYFWFAVLTTLGAVVRIFAYKYWGRFVDKYGSRKILVVTGFFGCFTPLLWLLVSNIYDIALLKIFDSFVWAGLDMVVFNYLLDITPANKRPQYVANHNFFTGFGVVFGALTGAMIAESVQNSSLLWFHGLQIVFLTSFLLRIIVLAILPKIREIDVKQSAVVPLRYVFWQTMAIEPAHGLKNSLFYSFRYPEKVVKELEDSVTKIKYKINIKKH
ncbi:MAG TPA: MFS transporter [archaeon]|nr:MFS transporter [archaeon]